MQKRKAFAFDPVENGVFKFMDSYISLLSYGFSLPESMHASMWYYG